MTDKEMLGENAHISTEEVLQDISDTEKEIANNEREIKGFRLIGDRMSNFRADARESGIKERQVFIKKLKHLLELRGSIKPNEDKEVL